MGRKAMTVRWPITGWCSNGWHEGERHRNFRNHPLAFCRGKWQTHLHGIHTQHECKCECHEKITEMYESVGVERAWPVSGVWWKADDEGLPKDTPTFWRPSDDPNWRITGARESVVTSRDIEERKAESGDLSGDELRVQNAIKFGMLPPNPVYVIPKGETRGRVSRQLEYSVKHVCDIWTVGLMPHVFQLTCAEIAKAIDSDSPPSTGAITNVLIRWDEIGFAVHRTKPHRFEGYTPEGVELGVTEMYARRDGAARTAKAAAARGSMVRRRT